MYFVGTGARPVELEIVGAAEIEVHGCVTGQTHRHRLIIIYD